MRRLTALVFILAGFTACMKEKRYQAHGMLLGPDLDTCSCCGGLILKITNDTAQYRIDSLGGTTGTNLYSLPFPQRIQFNFRIKRVCDNITYLRLTEYDAHYP
jgi:hypothetical protein